MIVLPILFYCFVSITIIQLIYYISFLKLFSTVKPHTPRGYNIPVSIIICAKNESENLKKNLPKIIDQDYKSFEIVLINDSSSDDTLEVMESFERKYNNIKVVDVKSIEPFWGNKKYALTLGIKVAKNEFLIFTDADCEPASNQWIKHIANHFSNTKSIILAYGAYKKVKNSFLNALIRFETLVTAMQYFSYSQFGLPYMGVGRNLAYTKTLFFNNSGFKNHMQLKSGDDDLFINEVATKNNTAICFSQESFTYSEPKQTFKDWIIQKRRHISTAKFYKPIHKFLLGLFYLSQFLFWGLGIVLLSLLFKWQIVALIIGVRVTLQWITIGLSAKKLNNKDLVSFVPFLEIFLILFQLVIFSANLIRKPIHWK